MKILLTGGHLSPALAVIDEIGDKVSIIFVGRKYAVDNEKNFSLEYQEIIKRQILFYHLQTGRLTRLLNLKLIFNILKIPLGLCQALIILLKVKPNLILSFGGYIGFPFCLIGFILGVPIYIHEQTIKPGLTNRLIGHLAKKVFVAFAETKKYFPKAKVILSGNPVRKTILAIQERPFNLKTKSGLVNKNKAVIYFTGGSLGSHSINILLEKILVKLLAKYVIIHQTGKVREYGDYQRLTETRNKLTKDLKENYWIKDYFFENELGYVYSNSDLVVGRSGANTFFEVIAWKKPAVFIPLPWSAGKEQLEHAKFLKNAGVAEIFNQSQDPKHLFMLIEKIVSNLNRYKNNFKNVELLYKENAGKIIVQTILSENIS